MKSNNACHEIQNCCVIPPIVVCWVRHMCSYHYAYWIIIYFWKLKYLPSCVRLTYNLKHMFLGWLLDNLCIFCSGKPKLKVYTQLPIHVNSSAEPWGVAIDVIHGWAWDNVTHQSIPSVSPIWFLNCLYIVMRL